MEIDRGVRLITCFLPVGNGLGVLERLKAERGIVEASVGRGRGMGHLTPAAHRRGLGSETEKEILTAVVPDDRADEIFRFIFEAASIDRPHGGIMFMSRLLQATRFELPELNEGARADEKSP
jgi:nitrogen regulatory protein PII